MTTAVVHLHSPVGVLVACLAPRIAPDATLTRASQEMRRNNTSALLVGPRHSAIITERDLTRALAAEYPSDSTVAEVATPFPLAVRADTDVLEAAALMLNREVRHLIVELPDETDGIISLRQVMAVLLQAAQPEVWLSTLRVNLDALPEIWIG